MQYILLVGDTIILFNQYHQLGQNFPMSLSYWIYINKTNKTTGVSEKRKNEKPKRNIFIRSKLVFSIVCYGRYCISCCKCFCILLVAQNLHWTESWKYFPEKKLFEVEIALLALKEKYQQGKKKNQEHIKVCWEEIVFTACLTCLSYTTEKCDPDSRMWSTIQK